ncbi:MAG: NAD(P)H-hydrate dehydratase [Novosphingobium sp.]|nr:NAD(P)H-hydrate dehydratase [Novosphingobium sp.]
MAEDVRPLDDDWIRRHPLPVPDHDTDKNGRGRVLAIGGCRTVPGGIQLTAEAALRAGAGKVQIATVESAALAVGIAMPEVAVFALAESAAGEIMAEDTDLLRDLIGRCDAVVAGPAMSDARAASLITRLLGDFCKAQLVFDAANLMGLSDHADSLRALPRPAVLTPHIGELAAMMCCDSDLIERDRVAAVRRASAHFGAVCVLKGATSLIAAPDGEVFAFAGGGVGLATGGSGDVMAGIAAGLCARGADALEATLWAVWLHGEAGRRCAERVGPIGFLARELLAHVPALMRDALDGGDTP